MSGKIFALPWLRKNTAARWAMVKVNITTCATRFGDCPMHEGVVRRVPVGDEDARQQRQERRADDEQPVEPGTEDEARRCARAPIAAAGGFA